MFILLVHPIFNRAPGLEVFGRCLYRVHFVGLGQRTKTAWWSESAGDYIEVLPPARSNMRLRVCGCIKHGLPLLNAGASQVTSWTR